MDGSQVYIIAEAGVNHNGSADLAFELIDAAVDAGANAVKFQTFKAENLVTETAKKAEYQKQTTASNETQYAMLKRLELSYELHHDLIRYCEKKGIEFLSTAFDSDSLRFLTRDLGLRTLKIPSGEITNAPLILEHAITDAQLIVSTGMSTLAEIEAALGVIAYGLISPDEPPSRESFACAYFSDAGQTALKEKVLLLHCTTEYPAPESDINLLAMDTMRQAFSLPIGYSDHSEGIVVPIAAVARGAVLLEKHFTLDKTSEGPDHKASLDPDELKAMVESIRIVEKTFGSGIKEPRPSELKNMEVARKSLVAASDILEGAVFTEQNLTVKRPGSGISPMEYWEVVGSNARKSYKKGDILQ